MATTARRGLALVFPGQGAQRVGMGADLLAEWPRLAGDVLDEASEAAKLPLRRLMTEGPAERLTRTEVAQPALLAHSVAVLRVLQAEAGLRVAAPQVKLVLGHSLGEYSALVAADALGLADAARLVHVRGQAMQRAVPVGAGAMAALLPVRPEDAEQLCAEAARATDAVCQVANYNSSKQTVISGATRAVDAAVAAAKATKKARRAVRLDVSAPFHCALMAPAAEELRVHLAALLAASGRLRTPQVPLVWNVAASADVKTPEELAAELEQQVVAPVRWSQSVDLCVASGVTHFLELGCGGVLSALIRQQTTGATATSCGTAEQIKTFLRERQ